MSGSGSRRHFAAAFIGGFAAIVVSLAVCWPIGLGLALIIALIWTSMIQRRLSAADRAVEKDHELLEELSRLDSAGWQLQA